MIKSKSYTDIRKEVEQWFEENIDPELMKELDSKPMNPKIKEMFEKANRLTYGAYIEIPKFEADQ